MGRHLSHPSSAPLSQAPQGCSWCSGSVQGIFLHCHMAVITPILQRKKQRLREIRELSRKAHHHMLLGSRGQRSSGSHLSFLWLQTVSLQSNTKSRFITLEIITSPHRCKPNNRIMSLSPIYIFVHFYLASKYISGGSSSLSLILSPMKNNTDQHLLKTH